MKYILLENIVIVIYIYIYIKEHSQLGSQMANVWHSATMPS